MIGKGKFFDIISRTADDVNNTEIDISTLLQNFQTRENKRIKKNNNDIEE